MPVLVPTIMHDVFLLVRGGWWMRGAGGRWAEWPGGVLAAGHRRRTRQPTMGKDALMASSSWLGRVAGTQGRWEACGAARRRPRASRGRWTRRATAGKMGLGLGLELRRNLQSPLDLEGWPGGGGRLDGGGGSRAARGCGGGTAGPALLRGGVTAAAGKVGRVAREGEVREDG